MGARAGWAESQTLYTLAMTDGERPPPRENDPSPLRVEYSETLDDAYAHMAFALSLPWSKRQTKKGLARQRWATAQWVGICGVLGFGMSGVLLQEFSTHPHVFGLVGGALAGCAMFGKGFLRTNYETRVRRHNEQSVRAQGDVWPRAVRVVATPSGIALTWDEYTIDMRWKHMWLVRQQAGRVYFVMGNLAGLCVPEEAFGGEAAARAFVQGVERLMEASGETPRQRLTRYLADSDAVCPRCKYPLRGATSETCPECGREIDQAELKDIAAAAAAKAAGRSRSFQLSQ